MDEVNLYPSSGAYRPQELVKRKREAKNEEAQAAQMLPLIKEIVQRFEERIKFYASVDSIPAEVLLDPAETMHVLAANKQTKQILEAETEYLKGMIDDFTR